MEEAIKNSKMNTCVPIAQIKNITFANQEIITENTGNTKRRYLHII